METQHYLKSAVSAVALVCVMVGAEAAQSKRTPSSAMELAVVLANAKVPAGMIVPDEALSRYQTILPRPPSPLRH